MTPQTPTLSRRSLLRAIAVAGGVVTVPGLLAACTGSGTDTDGGSGGPLGQVTVGLNSSIGSLDISREAGINNYVVALLTQEALLAIDEDGALAPSLAESWDQPDPTTYVYTLREGVTFSDGTPMTAADVVASIERNSAKGSTSVLAYTYAGVTSVEATGDLEVTITLDAPNASFAWTPSPGSLAVTSADFLSTHGDKIGTPDVLLLGTGPYVIEEFAPDSHVQLRRNDAWWGGEAPVESVRINFVTDENARQLAMREGDLDIAVQVPLDDLSDWEGLDGVEIEKATDNSLVLLAFNTQTAPFDEVEVRRAVAMCLDREAVVESLLRGNAQVATTLPSPAQWGGILTDDEVSDLYDSIAQPAFDTAAAKAELAKSSVPDGFQAEVAYPDSGPVIGRALLTLSENLKEIGVDLKVRELTLEQWIAELGEHPPMISGWYFATTGDPAEYTQQLLNGAYATAGGTNIAAYDNAEVTRALDTANASSDPAERGRLIGEALVQAGEDLPYLPLWWGEAATAFGPKVTAEGYGPYFFIGPWAANVTGR